LRIYVDTSRARTRRWCSTARCGNRARVAAQLVLAAARALRRDTPAKRGGIGGRAIAIGVVGLTGTICLQYLAFASAPLVAANAIAYAWPLLAAAWAAIAPGARGSRASLGFAVVGFGGVVLLFAARGGGGLSGTAPMLGYVAALGSAFAMACYTLMAGRSGARTSDLLLIGTGVGALGTIPAALLEGAPWSPAWAVAWRAAAWRRRQERDGHRPGHCVKVPHATA